MDDKRPSTFLVSSPRGLTAVQHNASTCLWGDQLSVGRQVLSAGSTDQRRASPVATNRDEPEPYRRGAAAPVARGTRSHRPAHLLEALSELLHSASSSALA